MRLKIRPWVLALGLATVCVGSVIAIFAYRSFRSWTPRDLAAALPTDDAVVAYLDLKAMRQTGLLGAVTGSKAVEEAEYREFVDQSGFDYKTDLDQLAISFQGKSRYAVAVGRFNWNRIKDYALRTGAKCFNGVCEVKSSEFLDRTLSFYPMHASSMAIASASGSGGVYNVGPAAGRRPQPELATWPTDAPVWIRVPAASWRDAASLPTGARIFGSALAPAVNTFFTIRPSINDKTLALQLEAVCATTADCARIHKDLEDATSLLKRMLTRDGLTPKPSDLASLLINGTFQLEGTRVKGSWPLDTGLIHAIFDGDVNQ